MLWRCAHKKLEAAARYWAQPEPPEPVALTVDDEVARGLAALGVGAQHIDAALAADAPAPCEVDEDFAVHLDCWDAVMFFESVQTQWIWRPLGMDVSVRAGLNYCALEAGMNMQGIRKNLRPALLMDLGVMELAVLAADGEARQKRTRKG